MSIKLIKEVGVIGPIAEAIKQKTSNKADDDKSKLLQFFEYIGSGATAALVTTPVKFVGNLVNYSKQNKAPTETVFESVAKEVIHSGPVLRRQLSEELSRSVARGTAIGLGLFVAHQGYQKYREYSQARSEENSLRMKPQRVEIPEREAEQSGSEPEMERTSSVTDTPQSSGSSEGALYAAYLQSQETQTPEPTHTEAEDLALLMM
jgi:hypothetical protein